MRWLQHNTYTLYQSGNNQKRAALFKHIDCFRFQRYFSYPDLSSPLAPPTHPREDVMATVCMGEGGWGLCGVGPGGGVVVGGGGI
uniref:Uncharacterized protein n=1 Tax=Knipowitschia caucasica TaxID=637954 RepID=A0AAV2MNR5_KNICA